MFLQDFPPMGVYETLFKFLDATGRYIGDPGTHPWAQGFPLTTQLPGGLTADELNTRLFRHNAAILHGTMCDMRRRGDAGDHKHFLRFSFGPLAPESFDANMEILGACLR